MKRILPLLVFLYPLFLSAQTIKITVDATEATRRIFHSKLIIPVQAGPLTLVYPKWLPGEHGPTGPVTNIGLLRFTAGDNELHWRRDDVDMYAFHLQIPAGTSHIEVNLDYLSPSSTTGFSSAGSATTNLTMISWNEMLLYPGGKPSSDLTYQASLKFPDGWKYATALETQQSSAGKIEFKPVSLTNLIDSPVLCGSFFRVLDLTGSNTPKIRLDVVTDSAAALEIKADLLAAFKKLATEAEALFGAHHFEHYDFLLTLSDFTAHFGLEHHQSSDDRTYERFFIEDKYRKRSGGLLPHEFVHSWNGKYRRPTGLATSDYSQPMKGELLWVYEGLTEYLGNILTARSTIYSNEEFRESIARDAAGLDYHRGRTWRPLEDTTVAAQLDYEAPGDWESWRRRIDFYDEGTMIWLEADVLIRKQTNGQRSLDDFCKLFHGGQNTPPLVKPYTFEDVVAALNQTAPYDWNSFLTTRIQKIQPRVPLGGIEGSGWRLVYTDVPNVIIKAVEETDKSQDLRYSIGLALKEENIVKDVIPDSPADKAGIAAETKLIAVNGRKYSREILDQAVKDSKESKTPIKLLVENSDFYNTYSIDYHGGAKYPHLQRDESKPDLLTDIIRSHAK